MSNTSTTAVRPVHVVQIRDRAEVSLEAVFGPLQTATGRSALRDAVSRMVSERDSAVSPLTRWQTVPDRPLVYRITIAQEHLSAKLRAAGAREASIELDLGRDRPRVRPEVTYRTEQQGTTATAAEGLSETTALVVNTVLATAIASTLKNRVQALETVRATPILLRDASVRLRQLQQIRCR